jgi:hypothetical protein
MRTVKPCGREDTSLKFVYEAFIKKNPNKLKSGGFSKQPFPYFRGKIVDSKEKEEWKSYSYSKVPMNQCLLEMKAQTGQPRQSCRFAGLQVAVIL